MGIAPQFIFWCVQLLMDKNDVFSKREAVVREAGGDEVAAAVSGNGFTDATFTSLSMILVSEVTVNINAIINCQSFSVKNLKWLAPFRL